MPKLKLATLLLCLTITTSAMVGGSISGNEKSFSADIKQMYIHNEPTYPGNSSETMVHVDGPGPIVSVQHRYYYSVINYQIISQNLHYQVIDSVTNNGSSTIFYIGRSFYFPADYASLNIVDILGGSKTACQDVIKAKTPYGLMSTSSQALVSPDVYVGAGTEYKYMILQDSVQYTISAREEKRSWSWGSWHAWKQIGDIQNYQINFNLYRLAAFIQNI